MSVKKKKKVRRVATVLLLLTSPSYSAAPLVNCITRLSLSLSLLLLVSISDSLSLPQRRVYGTLGGHTHTHTHSVGGACQVEPIDPDPVKIDRLVINED